LRIEIKYPFSTFPPLLNLKWTTRESLRFTGFLSIEVSVICGLLPELLLLQLKMTREAMVTTIMGIRKEPGFMMLI
jgi:hypothetical protein